MVSPSKYSKWYYNIINNAKQQNRVQGQEVYYEKHHIEPKCFGGKHDSFNIVLLTGKEHYICHLLLVFMTKDNRRQHFQMVHALQCFVMCYYHKRYVIPNRQVEYIRRKLSDVKRGLPAPNKNKRMTEKAKAKMRVSHWSKNGYTHPMKNKNHSSYSRNLISLNHCKHNWEITSPNGETHFTKQVRKFCQTHNLSIDAVKTFSNRGPVPEVPDRLKSMAKVKRLNTTNWAFKTL